MSPAPLPLAPRPMLAALAALAGIAGTVALTGPATAGGPTCFGQQPTIQGSGYVEGTSGDDVILATEGSEVHALGGGDGNDHLRTGPGPQHVSGGRGNDDIGLGKGDDHAYGGAGRDHVDGGPGDDSASGGGSRDTCRRVEHASSCER